MPTTIDDAPPWLPNPREQNWDSIGQTLWVQTDDQLLAAPFAGDALLQRGVVAPHLRPHSTFTPMLFG